MFLPCVVCEHAYSLAQNLDPNSEGQGVLQFKTGSMSVIRVGKENSEVLATLMVLWSVIEDMTKEISLEDAKN